MVEQNPLVLTIFISTCLFALCWGFMIVIWCEEYVILPDSIVYLIAKYPTVLTLVSTVISTILSVISTALLSFAVKKAINHYITQPISLVELHTAIALTKPQPLLRWDYYKLSIFSLIFVCLVALLNSSWTTLILPTSLLWPVNIPGSELNLTSSAFDAKLGFDAVQPTYFENFYDTLDIMALMSGTSATRLAAVGGNESVFAFNGVSYNTSSGGILPAVEDYAGTTSFPTAIGLQYFGGKVAVNSSLAKARGRSGLARNYTVTQQGLSANINCSYLSDLDKNEFSTSLDTSSTLVPGMYVRTWNLTASSPLGAGDGYWMTTDFWTYNNSYDGLLSIITCPDANLTNPAKITSFDIFVEPYGEYSFFSTTVCHVAPYVALFNVTYNQLIISVDQQPRSPIQLLQDNSATVTTFISYVIYRLSSSSQTIYDNALGELLRLRDPNMSVNDVLENYFRGVVEFFCHTYSAGNASTNSTMQSLYTNPEAFKPLNGTMYITTYGWYSGRPTYIYILCVFTVIWAATVLAAVYSLIQERTHPRTNPTFDVSNPVHLDDGIFGGRTRNARRI
ncbi:hypothetical protein DFJ58DRAFT_740913 [Suillus subalutaceus]|uniref:uncharacterized protein n=1 Tax=Suillus subalutaceus TaxID=48586 RepID=UPI001B87D324|nr:uncharacterized protein DFJ58DRAFT_740913 [Suillus subalutaceus]KAG1876718.1 hypothetical protein DFJ58DRAFT_740913 [Suillus subalutaceus]